MELHVFLYKMLLYFLCDVPILSEIILDIFFVWRQMQENMRHIIM